VGETSALLGANNTHVAPLSGIISNSLALFPSVVVVGLTFSPAASHITGSPKNSKDNNSS
jgi:hypothetical protein